MKSFTIINIFQKDNFYWLHLGNNLQEKDTFRALLSIPLRDVLLTIHLSFMPVIEGMKKEVVAENASTTPTLQSTKTDPYCKADLSTLTLEKPNTVRLPFEINLQDPVVKLARDGKFDEALQMAHSSAGVRNRDSRFSQIAILQAQAGYIDEALETSRNLAKYYKAETASEIASWQEANPFLEDLRSGNFEEAFEKIDCFEKNCDKNAAYATAAHLLARAGRFEEAFNTMTKIPHDGSRDRALGEFLLQAHRQLGK